MERLLSDQLYGQLPIVQGDVVKEAEDPRVGEASQFGIGKAATHRDFGMGVVAFDPLRTPESTVQISRKGYGKTNELWRMRLQSLFQELYGELVYKSGRLLQVRIEFIKGVGTSPQPLGIAAKPKVFIHALYYEVRKVLQVQGGQVFGFVLKAHGAKGPVQLIGLVKPAGLGEVLPGADLPGEGWIFPLQESHGVRDGMLVVFS